MSESSPSTDPRSIVLLPGIVDRPITTLAQVTASPRWRWVLPALICLLGLAILLTATGPQLVEEAVRQMNLQLQSQTSQLSAEQIEAMRAQMATFTQPAFIIGAAAVGSLVGLALAWLMAAALLYFAGLIAGADLSFGSLFAAIPWTWLPFALRDMAQGLYTTLTGKLMTNPGLSALAVQANAQVNVSDLSRNPLYQALSHVDLFSAWHLVLIYAALRGGGMQSGKATWLTVAYAVTSLLVRIIPGLITGMVMPG